MRKWLKANGGALAGDMIGLAGIGLLIYGAWLVFAPAGFIVAGLILSGVALRLARSG